jgi:hypothetical protein
MTFNTPSNPKGTRKWTGKERRQRENENRRNDTSESEDKQQDMGPGTQIHWCLVRFDGSHPLCKKGHPFPLKHRSFPQPRRPEDKQSRKETTPMAVKDKSTNPSRKEEEYLKKLKEETLECLINNEVP